jgi:AraC family transcriptional regulator
MVNGTVHVKPAQQQFWQRWLAPAHVFVIAFEKALYQRLSIETAGSVSALAGELGIIDPTLSDITSLFERELLREGIYGRFYVESLGAALVAYLAKRSTGTAMLSPFREARLAPARLRRVIDFIDAHLDDDLGLEELSAVAGLNVHHFAHAFKTTTGVPPHRFIIERRIRAACFRLKVTRETIAEIALSYGFASQSHFTQVFRRVMGMTPARYRHQL